MSTDVDANIDVLQNLANHFTNIEVGLKCVATDFGELLSWRDEYDLHFYFDRTDGSLSNVISCVASDDDFRLPIVETHTAFCHQYAEFLPTNLANLRGELDGLSETLATLPETLCGLLPNRRGQSWSFYVRRYIILPLLRWPRLPSRESWNRNSATFPKRPRVPVRLDTFIEYYGETNPTVAWQQIVRRIDPLIDDLRAVAMELGTEISESAASDRDEMKYEWLAKAMLLVREHSDWSDARIAREVGKDKSTLCRSPQYQAAAVIARGDTHDIPKGRVTIDDESGTHDVEAVAKPAGQSCEKADRGQPIQGSKYFREYCAECEEPIKVTGDQVGKNPLCKDCLDP